MKQQRGVALIIVLLIVAIVTVMAASMGSRLQLQVQRAINLQESNQAYWYAVGAEAFARKSIQTLVEQTDGVIHLQQAWAEEFEYPLPNGSLSAQLYDMQACFNLNAVQLNPDDSDNKTESGGTAHNTIKAFTLLLTSIEVEDRDPIDDLSAETLADGLADWIDKDNRLTGYYGAEDPEYESRQFPYLAANGLLANKTELRIINGADPSWFDMVVPYVCAIPEQSDLVININTLSDQTGPAILRALLGSNMSIEDAKSLIERRPQDGYEKIEDFFVEPEITALNLSAEQKSWFDITTSYFILHTKTRYNDAQFAMTSVYKVSEDNHVTIIRREFGGPL